MSDLLDDPMVVNPDIPAEPLTMRQGPSADEQADWHLREIGRLRAERATLADRYDRELERIKQRRTDRLDIIDRAIAWHERPLKDWHAALLAEGLADKTIHLPHGDIKARTNNPTVVITDAEAVNRWARETHPDITIVKVNVSALRSVAKALDGKPVDVTTGEVIPGCTVTEASTTFTVSPADGGDW